MKSALEKLRGPKKQAYQAAGVDKVALAKSLGVDSEKEKGCFAFLDKALDAPLPEPWTEQIDSKKRVFYWNPVSRQSSWQHPLAGTHKALVAAYRRVALATDKLAAIEAEIEAFHRQGEDEIGKWRQSHAPDGTPYFYKVGTQLTRWDNPRDEVLSHMELRVHLLSELAEEICQGKVPKAKKKRRGKSRERDLKAAAEIQRQAKVMLSRLYLGQLEKSIRTFQRLVRGFLGRCRARKFREVALMQPRVGQGSQSPTRFGTMVTGKSAALSDDLLGETGDLSQVLVPDEIGLNLGINFQDPIDMAAFAIMKELFVRPLPVPWQVIPRAHGRVDYLHSGMQEERRQHPLFSYFAEVLAFLRVHSKTKVPITQAMTAQIFREASPQVLRERLGVWEGPHENLDLPGGVFFHLIVIGTDPCCADGCTRRDDPRTEAAANVAARLAGWQYIWDGFAPDEPFPLLVGRMAALAQQLSEAVVVAPGPAAEDLLELMASRIPKPKPTSPRLTEAEQALQPLVVGMLGKAYGKALTAAGLGETRAIREAAAAAAAVEAAHTFSDDEQAASEEEACEEEEVASDDEADTQGPGQGYSSDDEKLSDDGEKSDADEALSEALARSAASSRIQSPHGNLMGRLFDDEDLKPPEPEPKEVMGFLPKLKVESAVDWATQALRPFTPTGGKEQYPMTPTSPGMPPKNLPRFTSKRDLWSQPLPLPKSIVNLSVGTLVCGPVDDTDANELPAVVKDSRSRSTSPKPNIREVRRKEQVKVELFGKSLHSSVDCFNSTVMAKELASQDEKPWSLRKPDAQDAEVDLTDRDLLKKPRIPPKSGKFEEGDQHGTDPDVAVFDGAAARLSTPASGVPPPPPYMSESVENTAKNQLPLHMKGSRGSQIRASSADLDKRGESFVLPRRRRPPSAGPRARKPCNGLLLEKPDPEAVAAAQNVKRFLSRTCGTMQFALQVFDPSGDGRFDRQEWEAGLQQLGYSGLYDVQALFTILDKRRHHVLTLSDLLDKYSGTNVFTGIPTLGLRGIAAEIVYEAMAECMESVVHEALRDTLEELLVKPSGPQLDLPDLKKWLKQMEVDRKRKAKQRAEEKAKQKSQGGVATKGTAGKAGETSKLSSPESSRSPGGRRRSQGGKSQEDIASPAPRGKAKKSKRGKKNVGRGSSARKGRRSGSSSRSSSRRSSPRRSKSVSATGAGGAQGGWKGGDARYQRIPKMSLEVGEDVDFRRQSMGGRFQQRAGKGMSRGQKKDYRNGFTGYRFVDKGPEFPEQPNEKLLQWMPRPVEDVCKTYGHIFRMLGDTRVAQMQAHQQKRSVHVSVPRMLNTRDAAGSSEASMSRPDSPAGVIEAELDIYDADAPVPAASATAGGKGMWHSKSSPGLMTGMTGASTTAGTWRNASAGNSHSEVGNTISLPPLVATAPIHARPDVYPIGGAVASGIDAESRRAPFELLAGTL